MSRPEAQHEFVACDFCAHDGRAHTGWKATEFSGVRVHMGGFGFGDANGNAACSVAGCTCVDYVPSTDGRESVR